MQKRERSPEQMVGPYLTKQFITSGRVHVSSQAVGSGDRQYGSDSSLNGITSRDDQPEKVWPTGCECHVPGCNQSFASMTDFEDHYTVCHRFVCRYCQCFYSTNHLLEIHLTENHDSFFSLLSRQKPMYNCLEESCKHQFMDAHSRQNHMTSYHGYPPKFHFDRRKHSRVVDTTGGLEESRDIDVGLKKNIYTSNCPSSTKVPEAVNFGIGGSERFQSSGT